MAIIMKSARSTPISQNDGCARTNIVHINKLGKVEKIQFGRHSTNDLRESPVVVMGYAGDNNATLIKFVLNDLDKSVLNTYDARLIIKNESNQKFTLSVNNGEVLLPSRVNLGTTENQNYQQLIKEGSYSMQFVLLEKQDAEITNVGHIGDEDLSLFREVFVSDSFAGSVVASGWDLLQVDGETNWNLYQYHLVTVQPEESSTGVSIVLSGCTVAEAQTITSLDDLDEEKINILDETNVTVGSFNSETKTLELTSANCSVIYPVNFDPDDTATNTVRKPNVTLKWTVGANEMLQVEEQYPGTPPCLGVQLDSYVTAIDCSSLVSQLSGSVDVDVEPYVIFCGKVGDQEQTFICPTFNNLCWVPVEVTHNAGNWQISPVLMSEDRDYVLCYDVFALPVVSSWVEIEDFVVDTTSIPLYDNANLTIIDKNNYTIRVIDSAGTGQIDFTANQVDALLKYTQVVNNSFSEAEDVVEILTNSSDNIGSLLSKVESLEEDKLDYQTADNTLKTEITSNYQAADNALKTQIENIYKKEGGVESGVLITKITEVSNSIGDFYTEEEIDTKISAINTAISGKVDQSAYNTKITALENEDDRIEGLVTAEETRAKGIEEGLQESINDITTIQTGHSTSIATLSGKVGVLEAKDIDLQNQVNVISGTISDYNNYKILITDEIANRAAADTTIQTNLNNEISRATNRENELETKIVDETTRATTKENELQTAIENEVTRAQGVEEVLQTNISTNANDIDNLETWVDGIEEGLEETTNNLSNLTAQAVVNDYDAADTSKTVVAKIVFLTSEAEYEALVDAGNVESNTLYLIQEEEE